MLEAQNMQNRTSFSTSEVAKYCHVTPDTIRKWSEAGRMQVFKTPGGHRRIRREDLIRFLRANGMPLHEDLEEPGVRVLVVDDERAVVSAIHRVIERFQPRFEIAVATDGYEAGLQVALFRPNVVFLDLRLPGVDGFEVCRRIKNGPQDADTNVIAMTGYYEQEAASRVLELGASLCLRKPFTPDDIRRALAQVGFESA